MKKRHLTVAIVAALLGATSMSSCIGSFALTNKLLAWNKSIDNKFINEVVFLAFWIVPAYPVAAMADILVLNSIEFWSGESPIACNETIIEGNDGRYLVKSDATGYTITSLNDNSVVRLDFDVKEQTWSVVTPAGEEFKLLTFVDDTHVKVATSYDTMMLIETSQDGLYAYQQAANQALHNLALAK